MLRLCLALFLLIPTPAFAEDVPNKVTVKNLEVLLVDVDRNLLLVKGSVPGHKDSILLINKS